VAELGTGLARARDRRATASVVASQLELLRAAAPADDHEVVAEFIDDGYSGARLDRPALDRLRDEVEAGALDAVLCLCRARLARAQVLFLEELERFRVPVHFLVGPAPGDDPQAKLLVQLQGVIAEYERARIAERYGAASCTAPAPARCFWKVPLRLSRHRGRARTAGAHGEL
jgi:site-specific DNA recombinase